MTEREPGGRPRLVATDLDGTLLRTDGTVSAYSARVLRDLSDAGIETVLVTARPPRWLHELAHVVGDRGVALCGNGAFRYDVPRRRVFAERTIEPEVLADVVRDLRRELPGTGFAAERATGLAAEHAFSAMHERHPDELVATTALEDLRDARAGKLLALNPHLADGAFLDAVIEVVGDRLVLSYSGAGGLAELSAPGVTKASALQDWCAELGVAAEDVWAFGDMPNDLPMLEWAGRAIVVANGHESVHELADETVATNDDDGVARRLAQLL